MGKFEHQTVPASVLARKTLAAMYLAFGLGLAGPALAATPVLSASGATSSDTASTPVSPMVLPGPTVITQNSDTTTITEGNTVSCNAGSYHVENHYFRRFLLNADEGIVNSFTVNAVRFAVETATAGIDGSQPVEVLLYSIASTDPLTFANLTYLGSSTVYVGDGTQYFQDVGVSGTISDPTTQDLVVSIHLANGSGSGYLLFLGSNANGQSHPSYLAAPECGAAEPIDIASLGFPNMHLLMEISGEEESVIPAECGPGFEDANIIIGTEGNDLLVGTAGKDVIFGLGGDDNINGSNGDDCLIGGYGNDFLFGGAGNDVLIADEPQATMVTNPASQSRDRLNGSRGTDTCYGSTDYYYGKRNGPSYMGPSYRTTYDNCETVIEQTMYPYPD
ncbi:calcium-binding protein [Sinimarinibacterium sp. CAU 1509]|uniref:calcium-binding protein n=1 Tax=Sinimarinibacterium sp. CAU 1509 TaxID=2562283 RepID=UPI0010AC91E5|nr:calcium-binding protein [Sinimarinibacterium sp. CAU 1509]TJY58345.1 calcium-binding protein [Sinimarinibacterium sp. CAU 1509]